VNKLNVRITTSSVETEADGFFTVTPVISY
jgi:hypothetical protein